MKSILALIDFSNVTPAVVKTASEMARAMDARLYLLHAAQPEAYVTATEVGPIVARENLADALKGDHRKLQALEKELQGQGLQVTAILAHGPAVDKAIDHAKSSDAAFIVLGSHRHGALYHLLLGNVANGVIQQTPCPVIVVPAPVK